MKLFLAGGFLGSGKTTAILEAVKYLHHQQIKACVITNDQGTQQVDTQYLRAEDIAVEETAGSCFCCNLQDLEDNIHSLVQEHQPDVIFAESVGSCTDLVATVINPLIDAYGEQFDIVLSVFADVQLLLPFLQGGRNLFHEDVNYIYAKQLEEADVIIANKTDLLTGEQERSARKIIERSFPGKTILFQNSLHRESVSKWVKAILSADRNTGLRRSLEVDYNKYGAGEAEMAWLDEEIGILTPDKTAVRAAMLLINNLHDQISEQGHPVGHLKFLLNDGQTQEKISFTSFAQPQAMQRSRSAEADRVVLLINARIQTDPALLNKMVSDAMNELESSTGCKILMGKRACFKPGFPRPSKRMSSLF